MSRDARRAASANWRRASKRTMSRIPRAVLLQIQRPRQAGTTLMGVRACPLPDEARSCTCCINR